MRNDADRSLIVRQMDEISKLQGELRECHLLLIKAAQPNHAQITAQINQRPQYKKPSIFPYVVVFLFGVFVGVTSYGL